MRQLTYAAAICEAHAQLLESDPRVFIIGQGLWSPWYAGASMKDLDKRFGRERVIDCPVSENATTGAAIGAAIAGMRPIIFHPRMDFMLLAVDPIVNQAANWSYVFGGRMQAPVVIRAVVNRRGEQGAQHSQALQSMFAHVPGLKVVMPATPYDAKGLLISASRDGNPVLYIDDRALYETVGEVPEASYEVPIGKALVSCAGGDITVVATSAMVPLAIEAAGLLLDRGITAEIINLRSVKPWDKSCVLQSVEKTGRLLVVDEAWKTCGLAAEIAATVAEDGFAFLRAPVGRTTLPDIPAPSSRALEDAYYIRAEQIAADAMRVVQRSAKSAVRTAPSSLPSLPAAA